MNAYSYIRWSSRKQTEGDSLARQMETARRIATENEWNLIDLPPDEAVSSFTGDNLQHNRILGQFIVNVKQGRIPTPCVLIIEKLDRFSRLQVDEVLTTFIDLLKAGVAVYSCSENFLYSAKGLKENPTLVVLQLVLGFVAANQYSATISDRVGKAKQRKIAESLKGKVFVEASCPHYLDWKDGQFRENDKANIVRSIFQDYINGETFGSIAKELNTSKIKPLGPAKSWQAQTVKQILQSRNVIGEYRGMSDYFPSIITKEDFAKVQGLIEITKVGKGRRTLDRTNFLRGLIFCSECGKPLCVHSGGSRSTIAYFRCSGPRIGTCNATRMVRQSLLEESLFAMILQADPASLLVDVQRNNLEELKILEGRLINVTKAISRLVDLEEVGLDEVKVKLTTLKTEREELQRQIDRARGLATSGSPLEAIGTLGKVIAGDDDFQLDQALRGMAEQLKDETVRKRLAVPLKAVVERITVDLTQQTAAVRVVGGKTVGTIYLGD